jgi:hypothetical protein
VFPFCTHCSTIQPVHHISSSRICNTLCASHGTHAIISISYETLMEFYKLSLKDRSHDNWTTVWSEFDSREFQKSVCLPHYVGSLGPIQPGARVKLSKRESSHSSSIKIKNDNSWYNLIITRTTLRFLYYRMNFASDMSNGRLGREEQKLWMEISEGKSLARDHFVGREGVGGLC